MHLLTLDGTSQEKRLWRRAPSTTEARASPHALHDLLSLSKWVVLRRLRMCVSKMAMTGKLTNYGTSRTTNRDSSQSKHTSRKGSGLWDTLPLMSASGGRCADRKSVV